MITVARSDKSGLDYGTMPVALPGFEGINRYWDTQNNIYAAKIKPGEYYVSTHGELISTVLGSCVSACIRDKELGIGGMNHFMLPTDDQYSSSTWDDTPVSSATRYGNVAMERLINVILASGGSRENLEIKIFGGAKVLDIDSDVGNQNINFVMAYLKKEGHKVQTNDVGGVCPRKVNYYPSSGRVRVKKLYNLHNNTLAEREKIYVRELQDMQVSGEVDIF
jgi:chemotaxis protein CheD